MPTGTLAYDPSRMVQLRQSVVVALDHLRRAPATGDVDAAAAAGVVALALAHLEHGWLTQVRQVTASNAMFGFSRIDVGPALALGMAAPTTVGSDEPPFDPARMPNLGLNDDVLGRPGAMGPFVPHRRALEAGLLQPMAPPAASSNGYYQSYSLSWSDPEPELVETSTRGLNAVERFMDANSDWLPFSAYTGTTSRTYYVEDIVIDVRTFDSVGKPGFDLGQIVPNHSALAVVDGYITVVTADHHLSIALPIPGVVGADPTSEWQPTLDDQVVVGGTVTPVTVSRPWAAIPTGPVVHSPTRLFLVNRNYGDS